MVKVSIVIPTRNEEENIAALLSHFNYVSNDVHYETIVVDDSTDRTAERAHKAGAKVVIGRRLGLGQAITDGINASTGDIVVVMDADLSHRPTDVPRLLQPILTEGCDMTVGSRYVKGGSCLGWSLKRRIISRAACLLALPITSIRDATSGFFAFKKNILEGTTLKPSSWKVMLEVLTKASPTKVVEVPITFDERASGKSKFSTKQMLAYIKHLLLLTIHKYTKIIKFFLIAGVVYLFVAGLIYFFTEALHWWYMLSVFVASCVGVVIRFMTEKAYVFGQKQDPNSPDYEWHSFYHGNPIQRCWKGAIAKTIWNFVPNASSLLNVGCGSSPVSSRYPNSTNVDINKGKLAFLKEKLPSITAECASAEELPFPNESFDCVLCIEVLEHLQKAERAINEIARVLKSGGRCVLATPDYNRKHWLLAERFTPYKEEHVTRFTRTSLERACDKYGLSPIRHKYIAFCDLVEMFGK